LLRVRIGRPLLKLPIRFCGDTLSREVSALPRSAWMEHPAQYDGNTAVPLVSPGGMISDEASGPMAPTRWLGQCPYVRDIMGALNSTWGRSRLMGLAPGASVPEHVDIHYYWRTHLRIHIPVVTNPEVWFTCAGETVHMQAGECWILDSFYRHSVENGGYDTRVHLVLDTVGSANLWDLIRAGLDGSVKEMFVGPGEANPATIDFEQINTPSIMSPWEMRCHLAYLTEWTDRGPGRDEILAIADRFIMAWTGSWARYGASDEGFPVYAGHLNDVQSALASYSGPSVTMRNGRLLEDAIIRLIFANAIAPSLIRRVQKHTRAGSSVRLTA
jgi:hypothetical protein